MTAKIVRNTEGRVLMGGRHIIKLWADDTNGEMSITFSNIPAGSGIPLHTHSREDETFEIIQGELEISLDGTFNILGKGDIVFMPRGVPHGFKAISDTSMWVTLVPGGGEHMFVELAELPQGPPDMQIVSQICEGYGIKFL